MFEHLKKYTASEDTLRNSVSFDVSDVFLKSALTIERKNIGKINEKTIVVLPYNESGLEEYPEFNFKISREQHDDLVERFRVIQDI